ncbi:MAG: response regulator [Candidatus Schekmanbacteria bacterium]|nr:response regulator [Candidatus Schekmanbacteria bacterium]
MADDAQANPTPYLVKCYRCCVEYDAADAEWCRCIVSTNTLVCPHCGECFCESNAQFKQRFWALAPQYLWERRWQERHRRPVGDELPPPDRIGRPLVLIIDDDKHVLQSARRGIEHLGYATITAMDGVEGLELAERYHPELVLTDALMPKLDGRELCRRLKEGPSTSDIKVAVMTSLYVGNRYKYEAIDEFLADAYLPKPIGFTELKVLLKRTLGGGE